MYGADLDSGSPTPVVRSIYRPQHIAALIASRFDLQAIVKCSFLRRGFNDVYELQLENGKKLIARLNSVRCRGSFNVEYELSMLEHLKASNVGVAAPFRTSNGCLMVDVSAPEGVRPLVLFEYIEAVTPRGNEEENARLVGAELARIHAASGTYTGPASMYELNADHLIRRPLAAILQLEHLNAELTKGLAQVADELAEAVEAVDLRHVTCHGDCHGGNSIITKGPDGKHRASFFDFDDGGPGFLAYDLSVFLWAQLLGRRQSEPDDEVANLWKAFIEGYRTGADIPAPDMKSVMTFVAVRMLWLLGEYAGNVSQWAGTVSVPNQWVKKNFDFLSVWRTLKTPE